MALLGLTLFSTSFTSVWFVFLKDPIVAFVNLLIMRLRSAVGFAWQVSTHVSLSDKIVKRLCHLFLVPNYLAILFERTTKT